MATDANAMIASDLPVWKTGLLL